MILIFDENIFYTSDYNYILWHGWIQENGPHQSY